MKLKRYIDMRIRQILHFDGVVTQYYMILNKLKQKLNSTPKISNDLNRALTRVSGQVQSALDGLSAITDPSVASRILPRNPRVAGGDVVTWTDPMRGIWGKIMSNLSLGIKIMGDWESDFASRGYQRLYQEIVRTLRDVLIDMQKNKPAVPPSSKQQPFDWLPEKWVNQWKNSHS